MIDMYVDLVFLAPMWGTHTVRALPYPLQRMLSTSTENPKEHTACMDNLEAKYH